VRLDGRVTDAKLLQYAKQYEPIVVVPVRNVTDAKLLHVLKAMLPIVRALVGMVIDNIFPQFKNAESPMLTIPVLSVTVANFSQ
jgi:hypothetical protein